MHIFDYTDRGRRPSARQIVADWKKAGRPGLFQVEYGETYAEFERVTSTSYYGGAVAKWCAHGNGCAGVKRDAVVLLLEKEAV